MYKTFIFISILLVLASNTNAQTETQNTCKTDYISVQSGFIFDAYNSLGIRTFFEYQRDIKNKWQYSVSYEHTRNFGHIITDYQRNLRTNLSLLSINAYYKLNLKKDKLFWTGGLGAGIVHINWNENDKLGITLNASLTINIKLFKRIYLEASPLLVVLPMNRVYVSFINIENYSPFWAFTVYPLGIKIRL